MAKVKCPECKVKIIEKAKACPLCGYGLTDKDIKKYKSKQTASGYLVLFIIAIAIGGALLSGDGENGGKILYTKTALNIRSQPNIKSDVIRVTKPNEKLSVYDSTVNNFVLILDENGDYYGWASRPFLIEKKVETVPNEAINFLAYNYAEDFVKEKLVSPATADFPGTFTKRDHITRFNATTYKIVSWVDSQNQYGATVRSKFACTIVIDNDIVKCTSLDFY